MTAKNGSPFPANKTSTTELHEWISLIANPQTLRVIEVLKHKPAHLFIESLIASTHFNLDEWKEAYAALDEWLKVQKKSAPLHEKLEYLHCAVTFSETRGITFSFSELVKEMLERHGFDRAI